MKTNIKAKAPSSRTNATNVNFAGGLSNPLTPSEQLRRTVMCNLLWEDSFYENGVSAAQRIKDLVPQVQSDDLLDIVLEAANIMNLRHVPLLIIREMARYDNTKQHVAALLVEVCKRPDQVTEFMSLYWADGRCPIASCVKKGLKNAISNFNEYQISKYSGERDSIKLRDVMFLVHAKPSDLADPKKRYTRLERNNPETVRKEDDLTPKEQLFYKLSHGMLTPPDTWEHNLMTGVDKKETFERLMKEKKLGTLAAIRNIRLMQSVGITPGTIADYLDTCNAGKIFPYQFLAAMQYAESSQVIDGLERLMFDATKQMNVTLQGHTVVVVDISGSMWTTLSAKSQMSRFDAGAGLAVICRELGENVSIFSFSDDAKAVLPSRGYALAHAISNSGSHGGTSLGRSLRTIASTVKSAIDRVIVITDEQSNDTIDNIFADIPHKYIINVASYQNGIKTDADNKWITISGWSDKVLGFINKYESVD